MISIGTQWLNDYASALQQADSQAIAQLFHPGLAYMVFRMTFSIN
jgi:hypothetical protein